MIIWVKNAMIFSNFNKFSIEKKSIIPEKEYEMIVSRLNDDFEHEYMEAERKRVKIVKEIAILLL